MCNVGGTTWLSLGFTWLHVVCMQNNQITHYFVDVLEILYYSTRWYVACFRHHIYQRIAGFTLCYHFLCSVVSQCFIYILQCTDTFSPHCSSLVHHVRLSAKPRPLAALLLFPSVMYNFTIFIITIVRVCQLIKTVHHTNTINAETSFEIRY